MNTNTAVIGSIIIVLLVLGGIFFYTQSNPSPAATSTTTVVTTTDGTGTPAPAVAQPAPQGSAPSVRTVAAGDITRTSATLSGQATPNKAATQVWFEYGTTRDLGGVTLLQSIGSGSAALTDSMPVSGLQPATTYYYRLNAQNEFGTVNGTLLTFKTLGPAVTVGIPVVTTQVATAATTTATLRGTVNPSSGQTNYWFEYSTDLSFGAASLKTTSQHAVGAGAVTVSVQTDITGLKSGTTYYYHMVARNAAGTVTGDRLTFKTK